MEILVGVERSFEFGTIVFSKYNLSVRPSVLEDLLS